MKKYHQLLLLITSLASLVLFLIYRHEYNRLHYVLEVFNFFGQPCNISELNKNVSQHDWGPVPSWQENEKLQIYSAFWTNNRDAQALVLTTNSSLTARSCYLWSENTRKPVVGKFKYSEVAKDHINRQSLLWYRCSANSLRFPPYAVLFNIKNRRLTYVKKVLLTDNSNQTASMKTTICVLPSAFNKAKLVEFVSYHKTIGINSFIFYDGNVPHKLSKLLTNLSGMLNIQITFFPWNFPYIETSLVREIVTNDCIFRNQNQSNHVVVLETNEYLVPKDSDTIDGVLNSFGPESRKYDLPVQKFCIESVSSQKPMALLNRRVVNNHENIINYIYRLSRINGSVSLNTIDRSLASVHKYVHCNKEMLKTLVDNSIQKFSTDFIRSTLYQLLIHNML